MTPLLQGIVALIGLFAVASLGFFVWKTAAARVNGEAASTWKSIAEAYEAKLEMKDGQVADMRAEHARVEGDLRAQLDGLRAVIDEMKRGDQKVILEAIAQHEITAFARAEAAERRHHEALEVWTEIRDDIRTLAPPEKT